MTGEAKKALRTFALWAFVGGIGGGMLSSFARLLPVIGGAVQVGLLVAGLLYSLLLLRDIRRMDRERLEMERQHLLQLEALRQELKLMEALRQSFGPQLSPSPLSNWMKLS